MLAVQSLVPALAMPMRGTGPPVVFSSGLFGSMPRFMYTHFLGELERNATVVVAPTRLARDDLDSIADELCVDSVGLVTHSAFDARVLDSGRVNRAVLCDPVVAPRLRAGGVSNSALRTACPLLVVRAMLTYGDDWFVPALLSPAVESRHDERVFVNAGHADLLDDTWAELGESAGLRGITPARTRYMQWQKPTTTRRAARATYRRDVAQLAARFLTESTEVLDTDP